MPETTAPHAPQNLTPEAPFFSVITVCRNARNCIEPTGRSLLDQSCRDWEWIVVDGASTDGTVEIIQTMAGGDGRVLITSEPDSGIFNAMNKGVRAASGRYVHFLNADDSYADAEVLADIHRELMEHPETDFLYGKILVKTPGRPDWLEDPPEVADAQATMVCGCLPHQASFARRELFGSHPGPFDESLRTAGDYKWMLQAVSNPAIRLRRSARLVANYAEGGASANLQASLPESFKVINEEIAFQQALGLPKILSIYQRQVLNLRLQLQAAGEDLLRARESAAKRAEALEKSVARLNAEKEKTAHLRGQRTGGSKASKEKRHRWLPRWLRPRTPT